MIALADRPADTTETQELELRVFGGRLDGATYTLDAGSRLRVGHGFENDVVLRGPGTGGIALVLKVDAALVTLEVVGGAPVLLGCALEAGGHAVLPFYVPLALGEFAIALGEAGSARWEDVRALLDAPRLPAAAESESAPETSAVPGPPTGGVPDWLRHEGSAAVGRLARIERPGLLILAAVALLLAVIAAPAYRLIEGQVNNPDAIAQNLAAAGYGDLHVRRDPVAAQLVVEGRVLDDAAAERLKGFVQTHYDRVGVRVTTLTGVAQAVNELLQAQGVDAEAKPGRDGIVIHSEYLPRDRLAALRTRIRTDLPGAGPMRFIRDLARGPHDLQYFFASKRFGLASLVDGDPGHIVTQDGQFWFSGALLPTGHRLLAVRNGSITFERDGLIETLHVAPVRATPSTPPTTNLAGQVDPAATRS